MSPYLICIRIRAVSLATKKVIINEGQMKRKNLLRTS